MNQPWLSGRNLSPAQLNKSSYYSARRRCEPDIRRKRKGRIAPSKETLKLHKSQPLSEWSNLGPHRSNAANRIAEIAGRGLQNIEYRLFVVEKELSYPSDRVWFIQVNDRPDSFSREWIGCVNILSGIQVLNRDSENFYMHLVNSLFNGWYADGNIEVQIVNSMAAMGVPMNLFLESAGFSGVGMAEAWKIFVVTEDGLFPIVHSWYGNSSEEQGKFALSLCQLILSMKGLEVFCNGQNKFDPIDHFTLLDNLQAR